MEHRAHFIEVKWINKSAPYRINYSALRQPQSGDSIVDAIGIWVLIGKSIEEWLKINRKCSFLLGLLSVEGFTGVVGEPLFFAVLMPLIGWRLGQNYTITQKSGVSVIVSGFCNKWPNIDGTFEFVSNPNIPRRPEQNFVVQIKGTHQCNETNGVFKYALKSLAFPATIYCRETFDPEISVLSGTFRLQFCIHFSYFCRQAFPPKHGLAVRKAKQVGEHPILRAECVLLADVAVDQQPDFF